MSTTAEATAKIDAFEKGSGGTDWLNISKEKLIDGMRKRLKSPNLISTKVVNLCGPGAFFRCLIEDDPAMYVSAIIGLYQTNAALLGKRKFTASYSLRIAAVPSGMDQVDWILLSSLRDHENTILSYDDASGGLSGLTMPAAMAKWFKEANYSDITNDTNVFFTKGLDHIKKAATLRSGGKRVCLLIDANMLKVVTQNNMSTYPDHWVVLMSDVSVDASDNISLKVHSWGAIMPVPQLGTVSTSIFCKNYYGYVAAKPPA